MVKHLLANDSIGTVTNPWETLNPAYTGTSGEGLVTLLNNILKLAVVVAGIFSFINLIVAGYGFMSAAGNPEKITEAWSRIWQSLVGLLIVASSFVLAALFGYLVFGDPTAIISPKIYGPS
ncbi:MAG TPA: hypothetical protein VMW41_00800 [Candidatus Bathyarchaeia archaeon]|nr:hypothetical protein [Candidatus Bathyarchaeia archaeon]